MHDLPHVCLCFLLDNEAKPIIGGSKEKESWFPNNTITKWRKLGRVDGMNSLTRTIRQLADMMKLSRFNTSSESINGKWNYEKITTIKSVFNKSWDNWLFLTYQIGYEGFVRKWLILSRNFYEFVIMAQQ